MMKAADKKEATLKAMSAEERAAHDHQVRFRPAASTRFRSVLIIRAPADYDELPGEEGEAGQGRQGGGGRRRRAARVLVRSGSICSVNAMPCAQATICLACKICPPVLHLTPRQRLERQRLQIDLGPPVHGSLIIITILPTTDPPLLVAIASGSRLGCLALGIVHRLAFVVGGVRAEDVIE